MSKAAKTASEIEGILLARLAIKGVTVRVKPHSELGWDAEIVQLPETPTYFASRFSAILADMRTEYDLAG
jgi:hypothetical protein